MKPFFNVKTVAQVLGLMEPLPPLPTETLPLDRGAGRVLAMDFAAPHDLPGFQRSVVDGYAVRASDTYGSSESAPAYLDLAGRVIMGKVPGFTVGMGQCASIFTGGMVPEGANAVVMVEHTRQLDPTLIEVAKGVAPGDNLLGPTDDATRGEVLIPTGRRLRAQDLGLLASLGQPTVEVRQRPVVAILSTGDEVVPLDAQPGPGQVRDVNGTTLATLVEAAGGRALSLGLVGDDRAALTAAVRRGLEEATVVMLSGGSSVGTRDHTVELFQSLPGAELLVHGVAVSPGKPFIWARLGHQHLVGLPGQVASCQVAFHVLVEPLLEQLLGRPAVPLAHMAPIPARLGRNLPSAQGREDYWRVTLEPDAAGGWIAQPVFGKSGLIRTLVLAQGLVRIPLEREGLEAGETVTVHLFSEALS